MHGHTSTTEATSQPGLNPMMMQMDSLSLHATRWSGSITYWSGTTAVGRRPWGLWGKALSPESQIFELLGSDPLQRQVSSYQSIHYCASDWPCCAHASIVGHLVNSRVGLGMNDLDSPIWASDHLAVVADIELVQA